MNNETTMCQIQGTSKTYKIGRMSNAQMVKVAKLLTRHEEYNPDDPLSIILAHRKLACKVAAAFTIRGLWSLKFKWWLRWRWFYYVRQYQIQQLHQLIQEGINALPIQEMIEVNATILDLRRILSSMTIEAAERELRAARQ